MNAVHFHAKTDLVFISMQSNIQTFESNTAIRPLYKISRILRHLEFKSFEVLHVWKRDWKLLKQRSMFLENGCSFFFIAGRTKAGGRVLQQT